MANIADTAGIFVGDALDVFNLMESLVTRDGDAAGARDELLPVMQQIIERKQSAPDSFNPSGDEEEPRSP